MNLIKKQNTWLPSLVDDFFPLDWNKNFQSYSRFTPAVNIKETDKTFSLEIAAPGLKKEHFELSLEDNVLSIEVIDRASENSNHENFTRLEFNYNSFKRSFSIPESVELSEIDASYLNGVLTVMLPKRKEAQPQPKKLIKIK
jgi:HSP20 family protein